VYAEPDPGSGDDDTDGDQSSGTGPDRGTGTTTTAAGRNLYTADGDRIARTAPDGTITVYLGGQEITKAANGTVTGARYYSFGGQTVAMRTANGLGGVTSLINDPHGTPLASVHNTNWTTTSVDKHYTLPFGEQRGGISAPGDHEFLGKVRDEATGLTLVGARWYDETVGRFLTVDPVMDLTDPDQWNAYSYANNNPTTNWDPDGLEPRPWHQSGVGFSDLSQEVIDAHSSSDGWNTGWDAQTSSGPPTVSSGVPNIVGGTPLDSGAVGDLHDYGYRPWVEPPLTPLQSWFAEEMQKPVTFGIEPPCPEGKDPELCAAGWELGIAGFMAIGPGMLGARGKAAGTVGGGAVAAAPRTLWHGGKVTPEVAFKAGIRPRGGSATLLDYVRSNTGSRFASTTTSRRVAADRSAKIDKSKPAGQQMGGWVYEIADPGNGLDINAMFKRSQAPWRFEKEIAFDGGVPPQHIKGAYEYSGGTWTGGYVTNPGFGG